MKKILFASTALVAFGVTAAQAADPIKLELGGYQQEWVGGAENSNYKTSTAGGVLGAGTANAAAGTQRNPIDVVSKGEIYLKGSTKINSQFEAGTFISLYTFNPGNYGTFAANNSSTNSTSLNNTTNSGSFNTDQAYVYLQGTYGQLKAGQEDSVAKIAHVAAPQVGVVGSDIKNWIAVPGGALVQNTTASSVNSSTTGNVTGVGHHFQQATTNQSGFNPFGTNNNDDSDVEKISYTTPVWNGFQVGYSYVPNAFKNKGGQQQQPSGTDEHIGVISYNNPNLINGLGVKADFGAASENGNGTAVTDQTTAQTYQTGLNLSYQGFTLGGGFLRVVQPTWRGRNTTTNTTTGVTTGGTSVTTAAIESRNGYVYDYGIGYKVGPYSASVSYAVTQTRGDINFRNNDKANEGIASFAVELSPGVTIRNSAFIVDIKDQAGKNTPYSNRGLGAVSGLDLQF